MKKKKCKVIMLPTEKESCIHANKFKTETGYEYKLTYHDVPSKCKNDGLCSGNQHLYIISDDKIEEGDWYLLLNDRIPMTTGNDSIVLENLNKMGCKKIIATTDPKLHSTRLKECPINPEDNMVSVRGVSKPSKAFIEAYCKAGGIDEVDVEYEDMFDCTYGEMEGFAPKVNSDNTINIHLIKDTYTRDEVEELLHLALATGSAYGDDMDQENANDWIKHNL